MSVVEIFHGTTDLDDEASDLREGEVFAFLEHVGEGAVGTELEDDEGGGLEGEGAVEGDDVGVGEFGVDLELGDELLAVVLEHCRV